MASSLGLMLITLLLSGFFSGMEIAFLSANRLKIELRNKQGSITGKILSRFVKHPPRLITSILIGNNFALVIYNVAFVEIFDSVFSVASAAQALLIQTIASTLIVLFFGEYFPKITFRLNADRLVFLFARPLQFFYYLFWPLVTGIHALSHLFLRLFWGLKYQEEEIAFGKEELHLFVQENFSEESTEEKPDIDVEMFSNALEFKDTRAREFMIPRTEMVAMPIEASIQDLIDKFIETEKSKIVIYQDNVDQVVGYVHSNAMFSAPKTINQVLQPVIMVPESMPANVLLQEFSKNRKTLAIIVDEFGGTEGLVTIEDLVEEVFGEIVDEHDETDEQLIEKQINENTWIFSTRNEVDDLNKEYNLNLPEGDYNTLSGMIMYYAESIPQVNEEIEIENYLIKILDATQNKIETVRLIRKQPEN